MKLRDFIAHLQSEPDMDVRVEITKVMAVNYDVEPPTPLVVTLDFPIIGTVTKGGDLYLVVEAAPDLVAFGKDIRHLDGRPATLADVSNGDRRHD